MHKEHRLKTLWANSYPEALVKCMTSLWKKEKAFISVYKNHRLPFSDIFSHNASVTVGKSGLP